MLSRPTLTQPNSETMVEVFNFDPIFLPRWILSYGVKNPTKAGQVLQIVTTNAKKNKIKCSIN